MESIERRVRQMQESNASKEARQRVQERLLRYTLTVEMAPSTGFLRVADERLVALKRDGTEHGGRAPFIEQVI